MTDRRSIVITNEGLLPWYFIHPIDSLYTVESVKDTVPVIEHILGQKCEIVVSILRFCVYKFCFCAIVFS